MLREILLILAGAALVVVFSGNIVGSALAFFLFNAGGIALVRPVPVEAPVLTFYLPVALVTVLVISVFLLRAAVPRWAGAVLVALYLVFIVGGYFVSQTDALGLLH